MIQLDRIEDSKRTDLDKTDESKECEICHYNYFDNGFKSDSKICNKCDWGIKSFGNFAIIHANDFSYRFFMFNMTERDVTEFIKDFKPDMNLKQCCSMKELIFQKELTFIKQMHQKNICFVIIGTLKITDLNLNHVCNKCSIGCIFSKSKRIEILNVKGIDYRCILCGISRKKAVNILNNSVLEDKGVIILNNSVLEDRGVL